MKKTILCIALLTALVPRISVASPYSGPAIAITIDGHRWGVWTTIDTTSHDPYVLANTRWMSSGNSDEEPTVFRSYVVLGLGPFFAIYISWETLAIVLISTVVLVSTRLHLKKRRKTEQGGGEVRS